MRGLRAGAAVSVAASTLALTSPPASAATGVVVEGTMEIGCFGCDWYGPDGNSGDFTATGVLENGIVRTDRGSMSFTIYSPTGLSCTFGGVLRGRVLIGSLVDSEFRVYLYGGAGEMYVDDPALWGAVEYGVVSPVGNACGGPVTMTFAGELVGA